MTPDGPRHPIPGGESDSISITGLTVQANHGVYDFERRDGQRFVIDVTIWLDMADAQAADDLGRTVSYAELADAVAAAVSRDPVDLIETVAERVARVALGYASVERTRVTVHKPDAPLDVQFDDVSVTITRPRA
jgi:dihydroneopterin aldolase